MSATVKNLDALSGHLNNHPDIVDVISHLDAVGPAAIVFDFANGHFSALVAVARTLTDVSDVRVTHVAGTKTHISYTGGIDDTIRLEVRTVLGPDESDLLAANTPIEVDDEFPIDLLYRLTDAADAEAVPA